MSLLRFGSIRAVIDANVLLMAGPRDTLLRAPEERLYQPRWSEEILEEVQRNLIRLLAARGNPDPAAGAGYLLTELRRQFPEAMVERHGSLTGVMANDPKDRHVLAAAVACGAQVIITENVQHFMPYALQPHRIDARTADSFLLHLFELDPETLVRILTAQGADMRQPRTLEQILQGLATQLPLFIARTRRFLQEP